MELNLIKNQDGFRSRNPYESGMKPTPRNIEDFHKTNKIFRTLCFIRY